MSKHAWKALLSIKSKMLLEFYTKVLLASLGLLQSSALIISFGKDEQKIANSLS